MKSNLEKNNEVEILKKENEELKTRLSINSKIIQEFFKNSNVNEKANIFIENIKKENNILLNQISDLKNQNQILKENSTNSIPKNLETYENKLFIYENLLKEKQSIIVNLKEQNKNLKAFIDSNITKKEIKSNSENEKENKNDLNNSNNKYIIEEIYVISPRQLINTLNDKIELFRSTNTKLKDLIQEMKTRLTNKEKDYLKLEEELTSLKQELQNYSKIKNNEEIINQLIQYQSMKSLPISQSCTNFNFNNYNAIKNKNIRNKKTKSLSYINNRSQDLKKIMKEIEVYENVNKTVKEISKNDFDLTEEWAETLKQCGMTQEEFLKYCGNKFTNKLTNAIEYMYKILVDKNIQIKLITKENETLNEENIRLNKINIQMENINNSSSQNQLQKTYVNVGNNISHTNININMLMDYNNKNSSKNLKLDNMNENINASKELKSNFILDESKIKNDNMDFIRKFENSDFINKSGNKYKSYDKILKYKSLKNKKINNNSYNKLIKEKKNVLICKTLNLSSIKKPKTVFGKIKKNNFNYNKTIKNIFGNTEKIKLKNKERNTTNNKSINLNVNNYFTDFKLYNKNKNKVNQIYDK